MICPACIEGRRHTTEDWLHHPYAGHGWNGNKWTHADLVPASSKPAGADLARKEPVPSGEGARATQASAPVGD